MENKLLKAFNVAIRKLNSLEVDGQHIFEELSENDKVTTEDVEFMENHYNKMNARYQELELGIYSK